MADLLKSTSTPSRRDPVRPSYYARMAQDARRFRRIFNRENVISVIRTLFFVIPLTVLIWIYAEREQEDKADLQVPITVRCADPSRIATVVFPRDGFIICSVTGAKAQLDRIQQMLNPASPIAIAIDSLTPVGDDVSVAVRQKLMDEPRFKDNGIAIEKCSPENLRVNVDQIVEITASVVKPDDVAGIDSATFSPSTVTVRGPARRIAELQPDKSKPLTVVADIGKLSIIKEPGLHPKVTVPLRPVDPTGQVTCLVSTVEASVDIRKADRTLTVTAIPVAVTMTYAVQQRYSIEPQHVLTNVRLIVPADKFDQIQQELQSQQLQLVATVHVLDISAAKNLQTAKTAPVEIDNLPEGVRVDSTYKLECDFDVHEHG